MKIYIPEHIPSENKGEEAILRGIYQGLKERIPDITVSVFSYFPEVDRINYGKDIEVVGGICFRPYAHKSAVLRVVDTCYIYLRHFLFMILFRLLGWKCLIFFRGENWKALLDADVILVGHDGFFSDLNLLFALFVKGIRKKTAIFGCGFGKFRFKITEKSAQLVIPLVDLVILREERTSNYLKSLTPKPDRILLKPDPAFIMNPESKDIVEALLRKENLMNDGRPLIGMIATLGLAYYKYRHGAFGSEKERYESYTRFFAEIAEKIVEITKGNIVFLPHCIKSGNWLTDDRAIARDIKAHMSRSAEKVILIENEYDAATLKGFIGRLDFLVSMRLHAVIGATAVGTPFISIAIKEDGRSHDIVEKCIGRSDLLYDINNPDVLEFYRLFTEKWNQRTEIRQYLNRQALLIQKDSAEAFDMLAALLKQDNRRATFDRKKADK